MWYSENVKKTVMSLKVEVQLISGRFMLFYHFIPDKASNHFNQLESRKAVE